jgi:hypothetical protein
MQQSQKESVHDDAARLLKKYAARLPTLTAERRRRIVSAVASDLEQQKKPRARSAA